MRRPRQAASAPGLLVAAAAAAMAAACGGPGSVAGPSGVLVLSGPYTLELSPASVCRTLPAATLTFDVEATSSGGREGDSARITLPSGNDALHIDLLYEGGGVVVGPTQAQAVRTISGQTVSWSGVVKGSLRVGARGHAEVVGGSFDGTIWLGGLLDDRAPRCTAIHRWALRAR